eukprot:Sspe_Gene.37386::Locus_18049_Transcript_2_2_Confidence_0.750_Length_4017::g.37386::m.37386
MPLLALLLLLVGGLHGGSALHPSCLVDGTSGNAHYALTPLGGLHVPENKGKVVTGRGLVREHSSGTLRGIVDIVPFTITLTPSDGPFLLRGDSVTFTALLVSPARPRRPGVRPLPALMENATLLCSSELVTAAPDAAEAYDVLGVHFAPTDLVPSSPSLPPPPLLANFPAPVAYGKKSGVEIWIRGAEYAARGADGSVYRRVDNGVVLGPLTEDLGMGVTARGRVVVGGLPFKLYTTLPEDIPVVVDDTLKGRLFYALDGLGRHVAVRVVLAFSDYVYAEVLNGLHVPWVIPRSSLRPAQEAVAGIQVQKIPGEWRFGGDVRETGVVLRVDDGVANVRFSSGEELPCSMGKGGAWDALYLNVKVPDIEYASSRRRGLATTVNCKQLRARLADAEMDWGDLEDYGGCSVAGSLVEVLYYDGDAERVKVSVLPAMTPHVWLPSSALSFKMLDDEL